MDAETRRALERVWDLAKIEHSKREAQVSGGEQKTTDFGDAHKK